MHDAHRQSFKHTKEFIYSEIFICDLSQWFVSSQGKWSQAAPEGSGWISGIISVLKMWLSIGTGCLRRWWNHHPWEGSENEWTWYFAVLLVLSWRLELRILEVYFNLNDSMIHWPGCQDSKSRDRIWFLLAKGHGGIERSLYSHEILKISQLCSFFFLMAAIRLSWSESLPTNYNLLKKRSQWLWKRKFVRVQRWLCNACAHPFSVEVLHSELSGGTENIILARFRPQLFLFKDYWSTVIDSHLQSGCSCKEESKEEWKLIYLACSLHKFQGL